MIIEILIFRLNYGHMVALVLTFHLNILIYNSDAVTVNAILACHSFWFLRLSVLLELICDRISHCFRPKVAQIAFV